MDIQMIVHSCNPLLYCRLCELAGVPTPPYLVNGVITPTPINMADSPPLFALPTLATCQFRGDIVNGQAVSEAGYNTARTYYYCEHPTLQLGIVRTCSTCGDLKKAPYCGATCEGYLAEAD